VFESNPSTNICKKQESIVVFTSRKEIEVLGTAFLTKFYIVFDGSRREWAVSEIPQNRMSRDNSFLHNYPQLPVSEKVNGYRVSMSNRRV